MTDHKDVSMLIFITRKFHKMNQTEFAKHLGIGRSTLWRWEAKGDATQLAPRLWECIRDNAKDTLLAGNEIASDDQARRVSRHEPTPVLIAGRPQRGNHP